MFSPRVLASGAVAVLDPRNRVVRIVPAAQAVEGVEFRVGPEYVFVNPCGWLVEVPNGNPEPSCREDAYSIVECGNHAVHDADGFECVAGHAHNSYVPPSRPRVAH